MSMLGFDQEQHGLAHNVLITFKNEVDGVGVYGCDLEVEGGAGLNSEKYLHDLEELLQKELSKKSGFLSVTCVLKKDDTVSASTATAISPASKFQLSKVFGVTVSTFNNYEISRGLKEDVFKLLTRFFDSETKGGYGGVSAAVFLNEQKTRPDHLCLHLVVSTDYFNASEEACSQRMWALCQRLETWMNVQLYAKYSEYNATVCIPKTNELKFSML